MKRKTLGIVLIVTPIPLLAMTLCVYAIVSFIIASTAGVNADASVVSQLIRVFLGLVGIVAVIGIPIGMPFGIYLLVTSEKQETPNGMTPPPLPPLMPNL